MENTKTLNVFYLVVNLGLATSAVLFWNTPASVFCSVAMMFTYDKIRYVKKPNNTVPNKIKTSEIKSIIKEETKKIVDEHKTQEQEVDLIPFRPPGMMSFHDFIPFYSTKINFTEEEKEAIHHLSLFNGMKLRDNIEFPINPNNIYFDPQNSYGLDYNVDPFKKKFTLREVLYMIDGAALKSFDEKADCPPNFEDYEFSFGAAGMRFNRFHWKLFKKLIGKEDEIPMSKSELDDVLEVEKLFKRDSFDFNLNATAISASFPSTSFRSRHSSFSASAVTA